MTQPHAQDDRTLGQAAQDETVVPPAPANQWTPHDGGIEPAAPPLDAPATALRRFGRSVRRLFRGRG
jgi:hypothetical protein